MPINNRVVIKPVYTKAARGVLSRLTSGRFNTNYLLQSENLGTTWINSGSSNSTNATASPVGTLTADKLVEGAAGTFHLVRQDLTVTTGAVFSGGVYLASAGRTFARLQISNSLESVGSFVDINLSTGALGTATAFGGALGTLAGISRASNGFWRIGLTTTIGASSTTLRFQILTASALGTVNYAGDGSSGIYVWGAHLNYGTSLDNYVATTTLPVTEEEVA